MKIFAALLAVCLVGAVNCGRMRRQAIVFPGEVNYDRVKDPPSIKVQVTDGFIQGLGIQQTGPSQPSGNLPAQPLQTSTAAPPSPQVSACTEDCVLIIPETYNPICGTNMQVYRNQAHFNCVRECGVVVDVLQRRSCPSRLDTTVRPSQQFL